MKPELIFPSILIALDLGAAIAYSWGGNFRLAIYWAAAAILTASITF